METFNEAYADTVYINFDSNSRMADLFSSDLDTDRLILGLELYAGRKINPENTLLIFDEVQEVPRALASLKYFYENAPQYHIVCAGSLLGIALHQGTSFPVGKVDFLKLYPLSFSEFLMATGNERFAELLKKQDYEMITSLLISAWKWRISGFCPFTSSELGRSFWQVFFEKIFCSKHENRRKA